MKILTRRSLFIGGAIALSLMIFIFWSARSAWIVSHEISARHAERIFQRDDFPDNARAMLLRMNNFLLIREFRPSQVNSIRPRFEALANELSAGFENEESILPDNAKRGAVQQMKLDFDDYLESAYSFMDTAREETQLENRLEHLQLIREKAERIIITLNQISDSRAEEIELIFSEYKASQGRLYKLVLLLAAFGFLITGAAIFIIVRNRVASLRLDLARSKLTQEKQERLASLGTLASGVAHEIRNPLTAIKARLFALNKKIESNPQAHEQIDGISKEINRLEKIVKEFLLFARPPKPELETFEVMPLLEEIGELLKLELQQRKINLNISPCESVTAKGDPEQIKQILINLVQNAADASAENDSITLKACFVEEDESEDNTNKALIQVIDQGSGIPEDFAKNLFNPFFTTKPKGTGLGLSIAKRIAQTHKGDLVFRSRNGKGTTFQLTLPSAD